jgi:glycine/D-amino acid oxidase-like deaminating enzyme/nitrite reductase/ring-hydroxylating ferredoxin subunit
MSLNPNTPDEVNRDLPGKPVSLWMGTTPGTHFPSLRSGLLVDAVVVGAGITGITTATFLKDAGLKVAVIESRRIVTGVTGHTTAKITSLHGLIYQHLTSHFGEEKARFYAGANQDAIEAFAALIDRKNISCDFQRKTAYTYTDTEEDLSKITEEVRIAGNLGLPVSFVQSTPLPYPVKGAVSLPNQAQFHPRKYLLALAEDLTRSGVDIFEETRALDINEEGDILEVVTDKGSIRAKNVVIATHFPFKDPSFFFARMYLKRSYVLAMRLNGPPPDGMFYSTADPYTSARTCPVADGEVLLLGGQNHLTGHVESSAELYKKVESFGRKHFDVKSIEYRWSTQDNVAVDKVPYIGRLSKGVYVATGFGGWGMTHSMISAMIISDGVLGRSNPWAPLYDPSRFKLTDTSKLVTQNIHAVKHLLIERLIPSDSDVNALAKGEGKILKVRHEKTAVSRDHEGALHAVSPSCTHMGCVVVWNDAEHSWDCPCHGSRFSADGRVLHGPALKDLEKKPLKDNP